MFDTPSRGVLGRQFIDIHGERCDAILQILDAGWERALDSPEVHPGAGEVGPSRAHRPASRFLLFQTGAAAGTASQEETVTQTELRERIANGEHSGVEFLSDGVTFGDGRR